MSSKSQKYKHNSRPNNSNKDYNNSSKYSSKSNGSLSRQSSNSKVPFYDEDSRTSEQTYAEKYKAAKKLLKEIQERYFTSEAKLQEANKTIRKLKTRNNKLVDHLGEDPALSSSANELSDTTSSEDEPLANISSSRYENNGSLNKYLKPEVFVKPIKVEAPPPKKGSRRTMGGVRRVQPVPRDKYGEYILPVSVGIITVVALGEIEYETNNFHTGRYIWPVGYTMKRFYLSTVDPNGQASYTATVLNDKGYPVFQVIADDNPDHPFVGASSTGVWTAVARLASQIRNKDQISSVSGPDYYGFAHPTIAKMIQDLPNADKCKCYKWQEFEQMSPRHVPTRKWVAPQVNGKTVPPSGALPRSFRDSGSSSQLKRERSKSPSPVNGTPLSARDADNLLSESEDDFENGLKSPNRYSDTKYDKHFYENEPEEFHEQTESPPQKDYHYDEYYSEDEVKTKPNRYSDSPSYH